MSTTNLAIKTTWAETSLEFAYAGWTNGFIPFTFSTVPLAWGNTTQAWLHAGNAVGYGYTWGDTYLLVEEALRHAKTVEELNQWANKDEKKKRRLVELICKIQGKSYNDSKNIADIKLHVSDIKLLYKEIKKYNVMVESVKLLEK